MNIDQAPRVERVAARRLEAHVAQACSQIARHGARVELALTAAPDQNSGQGRWELQFSTLLDPAVRMAADSSALVEWAGARLRLSLPTSSVKAWLAARMPDLELDDLPPPLHGAAVQALLDEGLEALQLTGNGPAQVMELTMDGVQPAPFEHEWMLTLRSVPSGVTAFGCLSCDTLGLMLLAGLLGRRSAPAPVRQVEDVPLRVRAVIGACTLSEAQLRSLAPRDVVLLDEHCVDAGGELWLTLDGGATLRAREENGALIITQPWRKPMQADTEASPGGDVLDATPADDEALQAADRDDQAVSFEDVPVRLSFDLGERLIPLGALRTLVPGEVFPLDRPLVEGGVRVRANGKEIATGDLVDIDGHVGVQLRNVLARRP